MPATDPIAFRLHHALQTGALPAEGQALGQRLMAQLNQPTRVSVIGFAGAGKTSLANLILGARLMPELAGVPAVELAHGEAARVQLTLHDGTRRMGEGVLDPSRLPAGVVHVVQHLPEPALTAWSITEINLSPAEADPTALLDWMAKRSDIAIWCSQGFDDRERALWANVPDHLKDHSFLALTRADRLYMKGELASRIEALQPVVADEFLALYPVASLQAAAGQPGAAAEDAALWRSSGGEALVSALRAQVEQARLADLDHACVLLERYGVPEAPKAAQQSAAPRPEARPEIQTEPPKPQTRPQPQAQSQARPGPDAVMQQALSLLQTCADDLMGSADRAADLSAEAILDRCTRAADDLARLLAETDSDSPAMETLRNEVIEGEQMLMLLKLERGESAAEDSLTILLQLKKEIAERVAS